MRLHEGPTHDGLSNGLGLSLAKQIIANAGGQLWYEPRRHGGARFIIELPEALPAACNGWIDAPITLRAGLPSGSC